MTPSCLSSITLGVRDRARSEAFYQAVGFEVLGDDELGTLLAAHGLHLILRNWADLADDFGVAPEAGGFRGSHVTLHLADRDIVDGTYATWITAGAIGVRQPTEKPWGGYAGVVADPDGHLWEMCFVAGIESVLGLCRSDTDTGTVTASDDPDVAEPADTAEGRDTAEPAA
ncbi:VOC family protein [Raineyella fluvialis]|uniref:VOC family protein n=1 Tax=Raineyella fluvialis TaxID=2662261 RepID=A0A5Q2FA14_9ACTN|nr:VOC family protein [Raineyella fluvialis]QGF23742.1 VOC family protein [Raineyella fluvialis]